MNIIKSVVSTTNNTHDSIVVGENNVDRIEDQSIEFDESIDFIFTAFSKENEIIKQFINGNLTVVYFIKEQGE